MEGFPLLFPKIFFYFLYLCVCFVCLFGITIFKWKFDFQSEFCLPNLIMIWRSVMLLCYKDAFFHGQLECTDCASLLLSPTIISSPFNFLLGMLDTYVWLMSFLKYSCQLVGSSVILDKLRIFFLLDSAFEDTWVMFSCVPVMHGIRRMLAQNNQKSQSVPVLFAERRVW